MVKTAGLWIAASLALADLVGCHPPGPQVAKQDEGKYNGIVDRVRRIPCAGDTAAPIVAWSQHGRDTTLKPCQVDVEYRGCPDCAASITTSSNNEPEERTRAQTHGDVERQLDASKLHFWCIGNRQHELDGCAYTIRHVGCLAGTPETANVPVSQEVLSVPCGGTDQQIWSSSLPAGSGARGCNVTLAIKGTKTCPARVALSPTTGAADPKGGSYSTEGSALVTFRDVVALSGACGPPAVKTTPRDVCTFEIREIECP